MSHTIPDQIQAIQQDEPGGALHLRQLPVPRPGPNQVLLRMAFASINPSDLGALRGSTYGGTRSYPFIPGNEGSGTVVAAGAGLMPRLLLGRSVACAASSQGGGTWAEYTLTSAHMCVPLLGSISLEQGAMLLVNPLSALALVEIARTRRHAAIVNTAAASALGGMLLRLCRRYHIPLIHIVRRPEQVELVRANGGEMVLDSSTPDFPAQLASLAEQHKATLLLDAIGGEMTQLLADAAPYGSTLVAYARLDGKPDTIDPHTLYAKHLKLEGWLLTNWLRNKSPLTVLQLAFRAQRLLASDLYSPVQARLPLSQTQQAIERYVAQMSAGKILLVNNG